MKKQFSLTLFCIALVVNGIAQQPSNGQFYPWKDAIENVKMTIFDSGKLHIKTHDGAQIWFDPIQPNKNYKRSGYYKDERVVFQGFDKFTWDGQTYYREGQAPNHNQLGVFSEGRYKIKESSPKTYPILDNGTGTDCSIIIAHLKYNGNKQQLRIEHAEYDARCSYSAETVSPKSFKLEQGGYSHTAYQIVKSTSSKDITITRYNKPFLTLRYLGPISSTSSANNQQNSSSPGTSVAQATTINSLDPATKMAKIHRSARDLKYDEIEKLVAQENADVNAKDGVKSRTALHYAALNSDDESIEIMEYLLTTGDANPNIKDTEGKTPLDVALEKSNFKGARVLLNNGANAGMANQGLDRIIATQETDLLVKFLQNGADANTALDKAVAVNNEKMVEAIFDNSTAKPSNAVFNKAVDARSTESAITVLARGINNDEALDYVIDKKDKVMLDVVLGFGVSAPAASRALTFAVEQRDMELATLCISEHNADPTSGMASAVKNNHLQMVEFLLSKGADPNNQMSAAAEGGKDDIINAFLIQSGDPNLGVKAAAENNQVSTLQLLLNANGDANLAMPVAIEKGNLEMVNMCISAPKPADVFRTEYVVKTCELSNKDVLMALLLAGADPNPGMPISVAKKDAGMVSELIGAGADANKPQYLIKATQLNDLAVAKLLLKANANPNPGMPIAVKNGNSNFTGLLLDYGADGTKPQYLSTAAGKGVLPMVTQLLNSGNNPDNGVDAAIQFNHAPVLSELISRGATANGNHHIIATVVHNNPALTSLVIDSGADPQSALVPAVDKNADKVVKLLGDKGVSLSDNNLLLTCVNKNYIATAGVLVSGGNNISSWWDNTRGMGMLHIYLTKYNYPQMINHLIRAGADVNRSADNDGNSPLHILVIQHGKDDKHDTGKAVEALIAAGANVNAVNKAGDTVLKAAPNRRPITKPLKNAGAKKRI